MVYHDIVEPSVHRRTSRYWHVALRRYLAVILVGNLVWEFAHMPLYTIWWTGDWGEIIFAAVHCTGGDVLIALTSLTLALLIAGTGAWPLERYRAVAALTVLFGVAYTTFSEWLNIVIRAAWAYSDLMPALSLFGFEVGLSPLLQWIVVPLIGFWWALRCISRSCEAKAELHTTEAGDEWIV